MFLPARLRGICWAVCGHFFTCSRLCYGYYGTFTFSWSLVTKSCIEMMQWNAWRFSVELLPRVSTARNLKYSKCFFTCTRWKRVPWWLHVSKTAKLFAFSFSPPPIDSMWTYCSRISLWVVGRDGCLPFLWYVAVRWFKFSVVCYDYLKKMGRNGIS